MSNSLRSCLFILVASIGAFAQQGGQISGRVIYGGDSRPLHQVSIQIIELKLTTVTDDEGVYEFVNVPPGRYTIVAHQEGFADSSKKLSLVAGVPGTIDFDMRISGFKEQVTVTATGGEQSTFESIASVSTVDSTKIVERAAVGLGEVLDGQPGVNKRSFGPGNSRPVIRGFDGDRVLVSTDGVREGSLASQSGDHSEPVDALSVERIEVVKGPATLLYGSNAVGGVVNAISGHDEGAHPGLRGYFSTIGGVNNSQAAVSGGLEYGYKNWMLWGNGTGQRTSDYRAGGDFGMVQNTFTRNAAGSGGFGYFAKNAYFTANYGYYQNRYGIPLDFNDPDAELRTLRMHRNNYKFTGGLTDLNTFITNARFTFNYSDYQHQELVDDQVGTTFNNKTYSFRGVFDQKRSGKLTGKFGVEGFHRNYDTFGEEVLINGPVKQNSLSVFALQELKFERVTFQFGGRVENNRYNPSDINLIKRDFTGFSGAAGARFALWQGGAFVANYSHSYRAPALEELYNKGPHDGTLAFEIGDANLRPEISNGIDLSLRHQTNRIRLEGNFYYYGINNFVYLVPTGVIDTGSGLEFAEYRQGNSRFTGTEFNVDTTVTSYLNLLGGLDYVSAELKTGVPLPRIPPFRARFGADIHFKEVSVRPEFVAVRAQDKVFTGETETKGYGIFNIAGTYVIPSKHAAHILGVNAFNLNNKLFYNHISFIKDISPEIGRGMKFSYTVRFF